MEKNALAYLGLQKLPAFTDRVEITMYVGESGCGKIDIDIDIDIDNTAKAAIDALVSVGVIKNDSPKYLRKAAPEWVPGYEGIVVYHQTRWVRS